MIADPRGLTCILATAPTNSTPFWDSGSPFGNPDGSHILEIPRLFNRSCRFNTFAIMTFFWQVPEDELDEGRSYRLRLSIDEPATTRLSEAFRISSAPAATKLYAEPCTLSSISSVYLTGGLWLFFILCWSAWKSGARWRRRGWVIDRDVGFHKEGKVELV